MSTRINESALLIQLENTTQSWIALDNEPDSFFWILQYYFMSSSKSITEAIATSVISMLGVIC